MCASDYYTPSHTNALNMIVYHAVGLSAGVSLGAVSGMSYLNFSQSKELSQMLRSSVFKQTATSGSLYALLPMLLFMTSLSLLDDVNTMYVVPGLLSCGILFTRFYIQGNSLSLPKWLVRHTIFLTVFTTFCLLQTAYATLMRD